ncbi:MULTISPECIES: vacuolating cytotoxin domain-containing protein [unclassified Helicobacter]|uniref:vacuolating cytotoxin domain-containing protein n=1 Tax=unclassified Helicobacter TaxID=2593540 RepID=UPI001F344198|nr:MULTISPECIES: vacuolating cytotoxin domain-containing protein [unclassified Helicobacter]
MDTASKRLFGSIVLSSILGIPDTLVASTNIQNDVYYLRSVTKNQTDEFYVRETKTYYSSDKAFSQTYANGTLIFGNNTKASGTGSVWFGSGWWIGYVTAKFQAREVFLTGTLGAGNGINTGGGLGITFQSSSNITLQDFNLNLTKAGLQNSSATFDAKGNLIAKNITVNNATGGSVIFSANNFDFYARQIQGSGTLQFKNNEVSSESKNSITIDSLSISGGRFDSNESSASINIKSLSLSNTTFFTKDVETYTLDAQNATYNNQGDGVSITGDWNLFATGLKNNFITISNTPSFTSSGSITLKTFGVTGSSFFVKEGVENLNLDSIVLMLNSTVDTGANTFNVSNVSNKTVINTLTATRGNIYANTDFNIGNLNVQTADFNPTTNLIGNQNTNFKIGNLEIFGGWGATTKATAKFTSAQGLEITNAKISNWSTLDAFEVNNVVIDTLEASYATIKAGESLTIKTASFSNNEIFLYARNTNIDDVTLENGAKLYIKSGETLRAKNLVMNSQSLLDAQRDSQSSAMTGDISIEKITFNNSTIKANNLFTKNISIVNNAGVYLKDTNHTYTNNGDLNISDGSKLEVYGGNMINNGALNFSLKPSNTTLIDVKDGYFQFNMNPLEEASKDDTVVPNSRINIYASTKDLITGKSYTLINAGGGIQFLQNGKIYTSLDSDTGYGTIQQILTRNIYFFDNQNNNNPLQIDFSSSISSNTLSFIIKATGVYVDITPHIKPGVWGFGGDAVFGIMNGAGGLKNSYTLRLEPKISDEEDTRGQPIIYYLKDYTYHNSASPQAVFTIDATGSKFVLGKNRENAGETGVIRIGDSLSKSNMHVKADDIYLGGNIILGDGALISGHLILETTKTNDYSFIGSNDNDHTSVINIRNHSSLRAIGDSFNYQGTILLVGNGTVSDEVTLDLSQITGRQKISFEGINNGDAEEQYGIYIHKLVARDARQNSLGGGISAKDFLIDTMEIQSSNNSYNEFLTDIGDSRINTLRFLSGSSSVDAATLKFRGNGNLKVKTLVFDNYGRLDVSSLTSFEILDSLSAKNSIITFSDRSQEIDIKKILLLENTTLETSHFSSYGLNVSPNSSFYQSQDDENGFADIKITGTYSIKSGAFNVGTKNITFKNLNHAQIENISASTWGAYGGNLIFNNVKNIKIDSLSLSWNSRLDTAYPTFDSTESKNANIVISSFRSQGGIFKSDSSGFVQIGNINTSQTAFQTVGINALNLDWSDWSVNDNTITASYMSKDNNISLSGLLTPNSSISLTGESLDATKASFVINSQTFDSTQVLGNATFIDLNFTNATATFNHLSLASGGNLSYSGKSNITINGNLEIKGNIHFFLDGATLNPIKVNGQTSIYLDARKVDENHRPLAVFNVYNLSGLKGLKLGTSYTLLSSKGGIIYHYTNQSGTTSSGSDSGYQSNMLDRLGFFETQGGLRIDNDTTFSYNGIILTKIIDATSIGFKIDTQDNFNPFDKNRIEYWFYRKGGQEWIDAINNIGRGIMDAFQELMIEKNNAVWANDVITPQNLEYFMKVGNNIQSATRQISSVDRKASTIDAVRLATDVNRNSRLVKLSSKKKVDKNTFVKVIQRLQGKYFAQDDSNEEELSASIYQHGLREEYKNNVWGTVIGAANFIQGGNGTLYGINVGYDRFIDNVIIGGYMAYAYSSYYGDLIQNNANNLNIGFYSRAFLGDNHEFDLTMSETIGWNQEFINSQEIITRQLNQRYDYNSYITNLNFNYGYLFYLQERSLVIKPQVGLSYFYIANSNIHGQTIQSYYQDLLAKANSDNKHVLKVNVGLETRKYVNENSYWYVLFATSQDLLVYSDGNDMIRFVGNNILNYQKSNLKNLHLSLTIGGEMEIYNRTFINFGLGSKLGIFYKDIGISGNMGVRYIF